MWPCEPVCGAVDRCRSGSRRLDRDDAVIQSSPGFVGAVRVLAHAIGGLSVRVGAAASTDPDQRAALVELYIATNGDEWSDKNGWQDHATGSDPCDNAWFGVECDGSRGSSNRTMYVICARCCTERGSVVCLTLLIGSTVFPCRCTAGGFGASA